MKILITGGCGFLGQHLTTLLLKKYPHSHIILLDLYENKKPYHNFRNNKRIEFKIGKNICDYNSIKEDFEGIDLVFHLAGIVSFWIKDKQKLFAVNVEGTKNVFNAAKECNVAHFIHVSSVAALGYKNQKDFRVNEEFKFNWKIAKKYKKYYMLSKRLADKYLEENKEGIQVSVAYPGLMLGPGDHNNSPKLILALKNNKIPFNAPGGTNIIDVRDVALGLVMIAQKSTSSGHYLLSGENITFSEQNKAICRIVGSKMPQRTMPLFLLPILYGAVLFIEKRAKTTPKLTSDNIHSAFKFRYFSNEKARKEIGWAPSITFDQTIQDTYNWMREVQ